MRQKNKLKFRKNKSRETILVIFVIVLAFFFCEGGCGSSGGDGDDASLSFNLKWPEQTSNTGYTTQAINTGGGIDCSSIGVATIDCNVYKDGNVEAGDEFACDQHKGIIDKVPSGSDLTLEIQAKDSNGKTKFEGKKTGIQVSDGETKTVGNVELDSTEQMQTYYQDSDGDGYGDPDSTMQDYSKPDGYVTNNTDCDDGDADIHPVASEVCGDDVDNDCDILTDEGCGPDPGTTWTEPNTGMEFVYVPSGCYQMGCNSTWSGSCYYIEKPVHEVCVDGFWISKYEVTIDEYRDYLQATGNETGVYFDDPSDCPIVDNSTYSLSGNDFGTNGTQPMVEVSWNAGKAMAGWLTDNTSHAFRLPTEAEWEYAARSGGKEQKYAGGDDVDNLAWYGGNSGGQTHNVGTKNPNDLGIYDMSGNVWEWCSDWYSKDYYSSSPTDNPQGPEAGSKVLGRGGSWHSDAGDVRTASRPPSRAPWGTYNYIGLRLVRTAD